MDLALCRLMHWTLDELWAIPIEYYDALVGWVNEQANKDE